MATNVGPDPSSETHRPPLRRLIPILLLGVVWLAVLAGLLAWGLMDRRNAKIETAECPPPPVVTSIPAVPPEQPAELKPRAEPRAAVAFYQDRNVARRRTEYDLTDPARVLAPNTLLKVSVGPFINPSNSRELKRSDINAQAWLDRSRVILDVCFNRTDPHFGKPGVYTGIVTISDPRVTVTDVTYSVSLAYAWWQFVAAILLAMFLPAVFYVWFLRGSFTSHEGLHIQNLQDWVFSRVGLMAIGAGVAAAVGIFSATYARAEGWGSDYTAATALFGATFSAFVAAATGVTAAGADRESWKVGGTPKTLGVSQPTDTSESSTNRETPGT